MPHGAVSTATAENFATFSTIPEVAAADLRSRPEDLHPSPGMSDEVVQVYLARDLDPVEGGPHPDDDEDLERSWVPRTEAVDRVRAGKITNALAVAGLLAASN